MSVKEIEGSVSMTREICKLCGEISRIGFSVPDARWEEVSQGRWNVLCVRCFATLADEMGLCWDEGIQFYPVPLAKPASPPSPRAEAGEELEIVLRAARCWWRQQAKSGQFESGLPGALDSLATVRREFAARSPSAEKFSCSPLCGQSHHDRSCPNHYTRGAENQSEFGARGEEKVVE